MSLVEYRVTNPDSEDKLRKELASSLDERRPFKIEATELPDDLSARRGQAPRTQYFELRIFEINQFNRLFITGRVTNKDGNCVARVEVYDSDELRMTIVGE